MKTPGAGSMPVGCFWIALVLFAIMGPLSWTLLRNAAEEWSISRMEPVPCTIVHARLDVFESTRSVTQANRRSTDVRAFTYTPRISYRIVANGKVVEGSRFASRNYLEDLGGDTARGYMKMFVPGTKTTCYADRNDPSKSALVQTHGDRRRYLLLIPGLAVALVSGLVMAATLHDRGWRPVVAPVATFAGGWWRRAPKTQRLLVILVALFLLAMIALSIYNTL